MLECWKEERKQQEVKKVLGRARLSVNKTLHMTFPFWKKIDLRDYSQGYPALGHTKKREREQAKFYSKKKRVLSNYDQKPMMLLPAEVRVLVFKSPFMNPTPSTTPPTIFETDATEAAETGREGFWAW